MNYGHPYFCCSALQLVVATPSPRLIICTHTISTTWGHTPIHVCSSRRSHQAEVGRTIRREQRAMLLAAVAVAAGVIAVEFPIVPRSGRVDPRHRYFFNMIRTFSRPSPNLGTFIFFAPYFFRPLAPLKPPPLFLCANASLLFFFRKYGEKNVEKAHG